MSPVECLPSASIAEIFFLHERAYRLGIYTLLLLGGKNLIPLVSAAVVQSLGWRWVFWLVAIVVGFCFFLVFFFVPESFWDRTPTRRGRSRSRGQSPGKRHHLHLPSLQRHHKKHDDHVEDGQVIHSVPMTPSSPLASPTSGLEKPKKARKTGHVGFAADFEREGETHHDEQSPGSLGSASHVDYFSLGQDRKETGEGRPGTSDGISGVLSEASADTRDSGRDVEKEAGLSSDNTTFASGASGEHVASDQASEQVSIHYTDHLRSAPPRSYVDSLKPYHGRLTKDKWLRVMARPFILFAYPAVLWSSMCYALAVGWLIVLSESVAHIYQDRESYNFTALQVGLVYISPFVGGVLGTAVAGKISDLIVRFMARRNDGVYEPEFRLLMAAPIALSTVIGLMGFGWSAEEKDNWIVPTLFFGVISFGCCLGSTTAVTFVVDSYRIYAGEALVTLNFCKSKSASPPGVEASH